MPISQPPRPIQSRIAFGHNLVTGEEVSFDRKFFEESHAHIRGSTNSGKTSRAILPLVLKLLDLPPAPGESRPDPIFIVDLGGDQAGFHIIRQAAAAKGRKFRFLSLDMNHDSDYFDPLQSLDPSQQLIMELVSMLIKAFNLDYGMFYGGDYYTSQNTSALLKVARQLMSEPRATPVTLDELSEQLDRTKSRDADQIRTTFMFLREYDQLKAEQAPSAERLIDIDRAIEDGEVVYFYLPTIAQAVSVRPVAGLALYTIEQVAQKRVNAGRSIKKSWTFIDEFHEIVGRSFQSFLVQCRHPGLSLFMANQHNAQLKNRDIDLEPLVVGNTQLKMYFSIQGEDEIRELQAMSKTTRIMLKSNTVGKSSGTADGYSKGTAFSETFGGMYPTTHHGTTNGSQHSFFSATNESTTESEHIAPELEINDILNVDAESGCFFLVARTGDQHRQPIPVRGTHVVSKEVYEQARILPLPQRRRGDPLSPLPENTGTKSPQRTDSRSGPPRNVDRQNRLAEVWLEIESRFRFDGP